MSKETKKTAAERIKNLEDATIGSLQALKGLDNEQGIIKEALQLLGNKMDAIVKLLNAGKELTNNNIASVMVENKAAKLAENTAQLVKNGILVQSETVDADSFVVGREVEDDGNVINPRLQFTYESAQEHIKAKILGAKVLDKILIVEGKARLEVLEIYSIHEPQQAPTQEQQALAAAATAPADLAPSEALAPSNEVAPQA